MTEQIIKIALTGPRPKTIGWGYDYFEPKYIAVATKLREHLLSYLNKGIKVHAIGGMALGFDTLYALVALKLKRQGYNISFESAIPCIDHSESWPPQAQRQWQDIVDEADKVTYVSKLKYKPYLMQKRNEYMVNQCDELIVIFNGTAGGTANCVRYAEDVDCPMLIINPNEIVVNVKGDLLQSDCDILLQQSNCKSTMGSGIAKQIKEKFPEVYNADCDSPLKPTQKLGHYTFAEVQNGSKMIEVVNLYGQLNYGREKKCYTDYEALRSAIFSYLENLQIRKGNLTNMKIGVPKYMGCARAGGDWNVVKDILEDTCKHFHIRIYVYQFKD